MKKTLCGPGAHNMRHRATVLDSGILVDVFSRLDFAERIRLIPVCKTWGAAVLESVEALREEDIAWEGIKCSADLERLLDLFPNVKAVNLGRCESSLSSSAVTAVLSERTLITDVTVHSLSGEIVRDMRGRAPHVATIRGCYDMTGDPPPAGVCVMDVRSPRATGGQLVELMRTETVPRLNVILTAFSPPDIVAALAGHAELTDICIGGHNTADNVSAIRTCIEAAAANPSIAKIKVFVDAAMQRHITPLPGNVKRFEMQWTSPHAGFAFADDFVGALKASSVEHLGMELLPAAYLDRVRAEKFKALDRLVSLYVSASGMPGGLEAIVGAIPNLSELELRFPHSSWGALFGIARRAPNLKLLTLRVQSLCDLKGIRRELQMLFRVCPGLRRVSIGGDGARPSSVDRIARKFPSASMPKITIQSDGRRWCF